MSMVSRKSGFSAAFIFGLVASCLGSGAAHAQSVPYWTSTTGFRTGLTSDPSANAFGNFSSRYNFENGWFVGSERGNFGFGPNSFSPVGAFGASSFTYEGAQAG